MSLHIALFSSLAIVKHYESKFARQTQQNLLLKQHSKDIAKILFNRFVL